MPDPAGISREGLFCPHCDYDLQGSVANQCPECGEAFDPAELAKSRIPWVHRREIGRVRAYWRTVAMATFRPGRLCQEVSRPVSYGDAQRFRLVTAVIAMVGLWLGLSFARAIFDDDLLWLQPYEGWGFYTAAVMVTALFVLGFTGLHTYWFHPRSLPVERQNRAVALAYYGCAPLSMLPLVAILVIVGDGKAWGVFAVMLTTLLIGGAFAIVLMRMLGRIARRNVWTIMGFAVVYPACCALLMTLTLLGIPVLMAYVIFILTNWRLV